AARGRLCCGVAPVSALGELVAAARLVQPDLLALDLPRIARYQPSLLQHHLEPGVVLDQGAGDAVAHCACLARLAAAVDVDADVEAGERIGELERLAHDHAPGLAREKLVDRPAVDRDDASSRPEIYASYRALAAAGAVVLLRMRCHIGQISR